MPKQPQPEKANEQPPPQFDEVLKRMLDAPPQPKKKPEPTEKPRKV